MRSIPLTILALLFLAAIPAKAGLVELGWVDNFKQAQQLAEEKKLPILVAFADSDCKSWCGELEEKIFRTEAFKAFASEKLILLVADFPRHSEQGEDVAARNKALAARFEVIGFPTILLLDWNGGKLAEVPFRGDNAEAFLKKIETLSPAG